MSKSEPASKDDVEEIVGRVVGEIVSDALQLISERFDNQDTRFDNQDATIQQVVDEQQEQRIQLDRIESKLNPTIERLDNQGHEIQKLKQKFA